MRSLLSRYLYPLLITALVGYICFSTYVPGTFLTGWDTLHPEFNFGLNISRLINGVWRADQGLGAVAGHSHMADLPRVLLLWGMSLFAPLSMLRYLYIFTCFLVGALGMYQLLSSVIKDYSKSSQGVARSIAFVGSLYYVFSLGSVQQFYAPFEMFPTQYAFLPWALYLSIRFLTSKKKRFLLLFGVATLLATPQAYAAHLWYAFFGTYIAFLLTYTILTRTSYKKPLALILVTLGVNSFWLLPNLYYIATSSSVPKQSKQNRVFSQEYRIRNQENGYLKDVAVARGFYLQWSVYNFDQGRFEYLMPEWRDHLSSPAVQAIGYGMFALVLTGVALALKRRQYANIALLPFLAIPFILLMNSTPPFSWLFQQLLRFSLFEEALRFVFTKFSILLVFGYTLYLALSIEWLLSRLRNRAGRITVVSLLAFAMIIMGFPLLRGALISPRFKKAIPQSYFDLWKYMKTQPDRALLTLPLHTFSGWQYYSWGYQGSGFIWFGMKQPVLDRDSDRWSIANEEAFRELQYTLYSQRADAFIKTVEKYNLGYILWDTSVTTPSEKNRQQILFERESQNVLNTLVHAKKLYKMKEFGSVIVYSVSNPDPSQVISVSHQVQPGYRWNYLDQAYMDLGSYISADHRLTQIVSYPFRNFLKQTDRFTDDIAPSVPELQHPLRYTAKRIAAGQTVPGIITYMSASDSIIRLSTRNTSRGISIQNESFPHTIGYVVGFTARNMKGLPLRFCLKNMYSNLCTTYDELSHSSSFVSDYFVIPPYEYGKGLGLYLDNISYGEYESVNELKEVTLYPLYYDYLTKLSQTSGSPRTIQVLTNGASFHSGWIAVDCDTNKKRCALLPHVLVNNWENGWIMEDAHVNSGAHRQYILFWPQILQFGGFGLVVLTLILASKYGRMRHSS